MQLLYIKTNLCPNTYKQNEILKYPHGEILKVFKYLILTPNRRPRLPSLPWPDLHGALRRTVRDHGPRVGHNPGAGDGLHWPHRPPRAPPTDQTHSHLPPRGLDLLLSHLPDYYLLAPAALPPRATMVYICFVLLDFFLDL